MSTIDAFIRANEEYATTFDRGHLPLPPAQFETIYPFLNGNGRVGRLLMSLMLVVDRVLSQPFLYLSLYFREHRADYYDALQRVRTPGDWRGGSDSF